MTSKEATPPATEATAEPTLHDTINEQFKVLQTGLNDMFKMSRNLQDQLKSLQKSCRQVEKKTRVKKKRPQESMTLSAELAKFLSQKKDTQMTKADVMKAVSQDKKNTFFLDLRNEIEINDKNFIDFCHFTKEGCEKFSNLLYENLKKSL